MEILTFPVGLIIGLFPVVVDLEGHTGNARLLLDGKPVCEMSAQVPSCMVDLGRDPKVHSLDLERLDSNDRVVESIRRWVNRPGTEGKVRAVGSCNEKRRECEFQIQWAHPSRLDPTAMAVSLDGKTVEQRVVSSLRMPFPGKRPPQILTVEAGFRDGGRASFTRLLHGSYPEEAEASLQSVALELLPGEEAINLDSRLRKIGWKLRAIEEGDAEILFVVEPKAFVHSPALAHTNVSVGLRESPFEEGWSIAVVAADESLQMATTTGMPRELLIIKNPQRLSTRRTGLPATLEGISARASTARVRLADAVATAGYHLGGMARRRLVVVVVGDEELEKEHPDQSTLSPEQVREYLRQVQVPIVVWHIGGGATAGWPAGEQILSPADLARAVATVRRRIERERVAWLEGSVDPVTFSPPLPQGVLIAGREPVSLPPSAASSGEPRPENASKAALPFRDVYSITSTPGTPASLFVGAREGLFSSSDSGETWKEVSTGTSGPVFSVAVGGKGDSEVMAGGSAALLRTVSGAKNWSSLPLPTILAFAVDPVDSSIIYAGMRGRVLKSTDGGLTWTDSSNGLAKIFTIALAVDPREHNIVYAGTIGGGVFKSTDAGKNWKLSDNELQETAVRCLAIDSTNSQNVFAGTDGGVFVSVNGGKNWKPASGLPRSVVYSVVIDPRTPSRVFAGTAAGVFESRDGAKNWNRMIGPDPDLYVTSLALDSSERRLYAGTLGRGVLILPAR